MTNMRWKENLLRAGELKPPLSRLSLTLRIVADLLALLLAFAIAKNVRLAFGGSLFARIDAEMLDRLTPPVWIVLALRLISAWRARLYRPRKGFGPFETVIQVIEAMSLATASTVLVSFALYESGNGLSRAFLALLFVVGVTCALALRGGLWLGTGLTRANGRPENVLIVGEGDDTLGLIKHLSQATDSQVAVRGVMTTGGRLEDSVPGAPVLGTIRDLRYAINQTRADRVFVVDTELPLESLAECVDVCTAMHIPLNCTGGGLTRFPTVVELTEVAGLRLLEVRRKEFERTQALMKRATDVAVAGVLLLAVLPLLVALAIAIKWNSPGPVLFVSDRVGRGGRHFKFLKFRSMVSGAEVLCPTDHANGRLDGHIFKVPNDSRITAVGRLMRHLSLDPKQACPPRRHVDG